MTDDVKEIPQRRDGTFKAWWYDRDWPHHIMHRRKDGTITAICSGHPHG